MPEQFGVSFRNMVNEGAEPANAKKGGADELPRCAKQLIKYHIDCAK